MYACKQLTWVKANGLSCQPPQSDHMMSAAAINATRGSSWSDSEVRALIAILGGQNPGGAWWSCEEPGYIRQKDVPKGYDRDWQQCRNKNKDLKKEYRQIKDHNGQTGRGRKTCKFYKELDEISGHCPASAPAFSLDTGTTSSSSSATEDTSTRAEGEESETNGNIHNIVYTIHHLLVNRWSSNCIPGQCTHFSGNWLCTQWYKWQRIRG